MPTERERVSRHRHALVRRQLYIESLLATGNHSVGAGDFMRAESAALTYVLAVLEDAEAIGLLHRLGHLTAGERDELGRLVAGAAVAS